MNIISPILDEEAICDKTEYCMEHNLNGYIIWEVSGDLMPDLSTPLIDAVHHKLSDPSLNCKDTFAYDKSTFSGYSVVPGIPKPVTASTSIGDGDGAAGGQAAMACPSIFYWGLSQYNGCTGYFNCVNGSPDQNSLIICEEDTLYDEVSFKCVDASLVSCSEESTSPVIYPSSSASESTSHSDKITGLECPSSYFWGKLQYNGCQGFFICVNGVAREDSLIMCEDGTLYNEQSSQCAEASQVQCSEEPLVTSEPEPLQQESTIQQFSSTLKDPDSDVVIIDTEDNIIPITQPPKHDQTPLPTTKPTKRPVETRTQKPVATPVALYFASMADSFTQYSSPSSLGSVKPEKPTTVVNIPLSEKPAKHVPLNKGKESSSLSQMMDSISDGLSFKSKKNKPGRLNKKKKMKKNQLSKGTEVTPENYNKDKKNKSEKKNKVKKKKQKKMKKKQKKMKKKRKSRSTQSST